MIEFGRSDGFHKFHQVVQLDHFPFIVPNIDGFDVRRLVSLLAVDLSQNLILLAVHVKISHSLSAQTVLQGLCNVFDTDSHGSCLVAVDFDAYFRAAEFQVDVGHLEYRIAVHLVQELGQHLFQFLQTGGLKYILYRHAASSASERRLLLYEGTCLGLGPDGL